MNKLNKVIIIIFVCFACLLSFCSEENKDENEDLDKKDAVNEKQEQKINEKSNEDETKFNNKESKSTEFFMEAQKQYEEYQRYLNSFSDDQAPSGINFFKKTTELGSFLNKQGRKNPEVIKTDTYKQFYRLFAIVDNLVTKSDEIEGTSDIDEKEVYIDYYNQKLTDINKLLDDIKTSVKNKE